MANDLPPLPEPSQKASPGVCCGNFTGGADYMGQTEQLCCGQPDEAWPDYFTADQMHAYARDFARAAVLAEREPLRALVADDAFACSFQSLGQYRAALLAAIRARSTP